MGENSEIRFEREGAWGHIILDRPAALNALTRSMVIAMRSKLHEWADDDQIAAVLVSGAGDKEFCAGGDIRWLHDMAKTDHSEAMSFFREEYRNNHTIFHYPKPYVSLIDGITMGGGVGVSVHGDFRIAGDRTLFAMPETGIGLFPDVGGSYFLPRLDRGLGLFLGLTGARLKAADCLYTDIATHYVPSDEIPALTQALFALDQNDAGNAETIAACLGEHAGDPGAAPLAEQSEEISHYFANPQSLGTLMGQLYEGTSPSTRQWHSTLTRMSPTSMCLTVKQLARGMNLEFDDAMRMEYRMVSRVLKGHDFFEGVRALIIDKDKAPKWSPPAIDEVSDDAINAYFEPLDEELEFPAA